MAPLARVLKDMGDKASKMGKKAQKRVAGLLKEVRSHLELLALCDCGTDDSAVAA
jgi:ElaB/YqjD/DUF883 family membrane-anchored ribosome-binding protein